MAGGRDGKSKTGKEGSEKVTFWPRDWEVKGNKDGGKRQGKSQQRGVGTGEERGERARGRARGKARGARSRGEGCSQEIADTWYTVRRLLKSVSGCPRLGSLRL